MFQFLLKPKWVLGHLIILALVVVFVNLGLWQHGRLLERRAYNATFTARLNLPGEDLTRIMPASGPVVPADFAYRRAGVRGTYDVAHEIVLLSREFNGRSGHHVLTPLLVAPNQAVLVDRGWVPIDDDDPPVQAALPPAGPADVTGVLFPSQTRGRFGPREQPTGVLRRTFRIDLERLQRQLPYRVYPLYLHLVGQEPIQTLDYPVPVDLPKPDEGSHLSYMLQWFAFAMTAVITYGALIFKTSRRGTKNA